MQHDAMAKPASTGPPSGRRSTTTPDAPIPWEQASLPVLGEDEAAARDRELGRTVVEHRGRWWIRLAGGFYQPVALLAELDEAEATRPTPWCWGFRARLRPDAEARVNAAMPAHVLPNLRHHDLSRLAKSQRRRVRRALDEFEVVALRSPRLLLEQGHAVAMEARERNPDVPLPERAAFERWARSFFAPRRGLVLAALREGRLLAFNTNYAVGDVLYGDAVYAGREGQRHALAACLYHAAAIVAARRPELRTLVDGWHVRERPSLCEHKAALGLELVRLPTRAWFAPGVETLVRRLRPHGYYRLTGRG